MSPDVQSIIERIRSQHEAGRPWALRGEEVASLLGIDGTELYRRVYAAGLARHPLIDLSAATGSFGAESVGELVTLLELFHPESAARELEEAGIFFAHERRVDMQEAFLSVFARRVGARAVDEATFSAMLRAFGGYERAREAYLAELPPVHELLREASELFCRGKSFRMPSLARETAEATLRLFVRRKVLSLEELYAPIAQRLRAQAVREGYLGASRRAAREEPGSEGGAEGATRERERAQRALEIAGKSITPELLRAHYRRLMKRYHPDVNPSGLERAKEINAAYSLLLAAFVKTWRSG